MSTDRDWAELNRWQVIKESTNDIVTPGNMIDVLALGGAAIAAPNFDKTWGIVLGAASYGCDGIDGYLARLTHTDSELGAKVDAAGDKLKIGWAILNIWKNNQAPRPVLGAILAQNLANTVLTIADQTMNENPQIKVGQEGKMATMLQSGGLGLSMIGSKLSEKYPRAGRAMRLGGASLSLGGLVAFGLPTTKHYFESFRDGHKKERILKGLLPFVIPVVKPQPTENLR